MMTNEKLSLSKDAVNTALNAAVAAANACQGSGPAGCARIYVAVYGVDRKTINAIAAYCKANHLIFQRKAYYSLSNAIYLGYSMSGLEYAKGEAFAAALKAAGIPAMMEACGD